MSERPPKRAVASKPIDYSLTRRRVKKMADANDKDEAKDEIKADTKPPVDVDDLIVHAEVLKENILDFIDEVSFDITPPSEAISRLQEMRTDFNAIHFKMKRIINIEIYNAQFKAEFDDVKTKIRAGIDKAKTAKSKEVTKEKIIRDHEEKAMFFQVQTATNIAMELKSEWCGEDELFSSLSSKLSISRLTDDQLLKIKDKQEFSAKKFENLTKSYQEILKYPASSEELVTDITKLGKTYNLLSLKKNAFLKDLDFEVDQRELSKRDLIKEGKLNIDLGKFSGYDSVMDIYTFQSEFEKLYLRTTTKRMLPDLLINNHLSDPALSLVKHVESITEIWERLKTTYGDTKLLLSRKVATLDNIAQLGKTKDPEKLIAGISQIISLMRDLLNLASKHRIEKYLFYGEGLERIYRLMGNARTTQWLKSRVILSSMRNFCGLV